jgi:hypothetical protein
MPAYQSKRQAAAEPPLIRAVIAAWELFPLTKALDPHKLRPGEAVRLLNSTDLGPVIVQGKLDRQRERAGFRIGDGKTLDFFRYVAWLFDERHMASPAAPGAAQGPGARLSKQAAYSRGKSSEAADIGPLRPVVDPARREACRLNLELFLTTYFPATTGLSPFSDDHRRVIARLQEIILHGGREAKAIYRGFAKTTMAENAALWAVMYGYRRCVVMFGATRPAAAESMDSIKAELETNDLLDEDFPEITQAIRALEGKPQRCSSQTCQGERTFIEWTAGKVALPFIEGSLGGGAIVCCKGIMAASRGLKFKLPNGDAQRPELVIIDDPQTDESAGKPSSVNKRLKLIRKVILRLAGHQKQIACVVNGTVIEKDDLIDQLTDPTRNKAFQSERIKMVRKWPAAHETFWLGPYATTRNTYDRENPEDQARAHREATELYRGRRAEVDAGGEISWEHCFETETEISALQHAYNILIDDGPEVFASECQQEPIAEETDDDAPTMKGIGERLNRLARREPPLWAQKLTMFVDVQHKCLYYMVCAFADDFTGAILDYGAEPEEGRTYWTLRDKRRTLQAALAASEKKGGIEAALWLGLDALTRRVLPVIWKTEQKLELRIDRCLIDSGDQTQTIYEFCRRSPFGAVLLPSKGDDERILAFKPRPGEKIGLHTILTTDPTVRAVRLLKLDVNFWKTFVAHRLATLAKGGLTVFGTDPASHELLAHHLEAEKCEKVIKKGRVIWQWHAIPGRDNHWLDCLVGCFAGASMLGCRLEQNRDTGETKKRQTLAELARLASGGRPHG